MVRKKAHRSIFLQFKKLYSRRNVSFSTIGLILIFVTIILLPFGILLSNQLPKKNSSTNSAFAVAGATNFAVTICLHGIGNCGDNANPNGGGNIMPVHQTRTVDLTILNQNNQIAATGQGTVSYSTSTNNFQGTIAINNLASGQYLVQVKTAGFLLRQLPGMITVTAGQNVTVPTIALINGDINSDNQLDIMDYNLLISCFGSKQIMPSCLNAPNATFAGADMNDNGTVNAEDYNLFLRETFFNPTISPVPTGAMAMTTPTNIPTPTLVPTATPTTAPTPTPTMKPGIIKAEKTIVQNGVTVDIAIQMPEAGGAMSGTMSRDCVGSIAGTYTGAPQYTVNGNGPITCNIGVINFQGTATYMGTVHPATMSATVTYTIMGAGITQTNTEEFPYTLGY